MFIHPMTITVPSEHDGQMTEMDFSPSEKIQRLGYPLAIQMSFAEDAEYSRILEITSSDCLVQGFISSALCISLDCP